MSWIIQKGAKGEIWRSSFYPSLETAQNNLQMAYPKRRFKKDDDRLTWVCAQWGAIFRFKEIVEYQENNRPANVDDLLKPNNRVKELEKLFHLHSNVFQFEIDDKIGLGRRIVDYKWRSLINDIIKLFKS